MEVMGLGTRCSLRRRWGLRFREMMCPRRRCSLKRRCFYEEKRELMKGCGPRVKMGMGIVLRGRDGFGEMILLWGKGDSWEEGRGIWNGGQARKKLSLGESRWVLVGELRKAMDGL
jgi:hypothetical protein